MAELPFRVRHQPTQIDLDALNALNRYRILDFQRLAGNRAGTFTVISGNLVERNSPADGTFKLTYTPTVPAWWKCGMHIGYVEKTDAAYHYAYLQGRCSPDDVDGVSVSRAYGLATQRSDVNRYGFRSFERTFKLEAGTTYTFDAIWTTDGGTWVYYQGPEYMWMEAMAFAR